jgi:hypothetical protein
MPVWCPQFFAILPTSRAEIRLCANPDIMKRRFSLWTYWISVVSTLDCIPPTLLITFGQPFPRIRALFPHFQPVPVVDDIHVDRFAPADGWIIVVMPALSLANGFGKVIVVFKGVAVPFLGGDSAHAPLDAVFARASFASAAVVVARAVVAGEEVEAAKCGWEERKDREGNGSEMHFFYFGGVYADCEEKSESCVGLWLNEIYFVLGAGMLFILSQKAGGEGQPPQPHQGEPFCTLTI